MKELTKSERQAVHDRYNGKCAYCGVELLKGWHVDHLKAVRRNSYWSRTKNCFVYDGTCKHPERDVLDNCMPACASCNINKRDFSLEGFRKFVTNLMVSLNRDSVQYKIAKRYGLIVEKVKPIVFYFETFKSDK